LPRRLFDVGEHRIEIHSLEQTPAGDDHAYSPRVVDCFERIRVEEHETPRSS
jgi:hypothetical protein